MLRSLHKIAQRSRCPYILNTTTRSFVTPNLAFAHTHKSYAEFRRQFATKDSFQYADPGSQSGNPSLSTIPVKPSTPEEKAAYEALLAKEAKAEAEKESFHLLQDDEDDTVFHHDPSCAKSIHLGMNPDGSLTFTSDETGDSATTQPTHSETTDSVCAVVEEEVTPADARLVIGMTCGQCKTRLVKSMPKRSYEKGVVLIRCDGCRVSHLIADHLGWFDDAGINIEMIMKEKGEEVVRASTDNIDEKTQRMIEETLKKARASDLEAPLVGVLPKEK